MSITTRIENGWLSARVGEDGPWVIISSDEGITNVRLQRRSESLYYIHFERRGQSRKRMLVVVGNSITVGPDCRA
jgi:hypothetical protein